MFLRKLNPVQALIIAFVFGVTVLTLTSPFGLWAIPAGTALVTTVGKNDMLTQYFKGSSYTAAWYVGLVDGGSAPTFDVTDTMASHAGWTENVTYSNGTRVAWVGGTAAAGSIDNSLSTANFNMNGGYTVAGGFMNTVSTKSGTLGTLFGEGTFTGGNKAGSTGDTIQVTSGISN